MGTSTYPTRRSAIAGSSLLVLSSMLTGCASFSPDHGMTLVAEGVSATIQKDVVAVRTAEDADLADAVVKKLLGRSLDVETAIQIALLNNKGLQAAFNELALAEADSLEQSLPPNPVFSISRVSGDAAFETSRQVVGDILALATLPFRAEIARERFRAAQFRAILETLRTAAETRRAYYRAVGANELAGVLNDTKTSAEAIAELAEKLGKTGSMNKLDQAREQVFYAEITADVASARQEAASSRERLARAMGLWDQKLNFRLPSRLPDLPRRPKSLPFIEVDAVAHRVDLQIAQIELGALAKAQNLTEATRFVTLLDLAGIDRNTKDPEGPPFRQRGFDLQFQGPIFDGGEVRVRQATEIYNQAFNRLTERAVNVRSDAREAYRNYRSLYDIAGHYQREVLPLRKVIADETELRYGAMQVDVFAVLAEARQRVASLRAATEAKRDFWLATADLQTAVNGGGSGDSGREGRTTTVSAVTSTPN